MTSSALIIDNYDSFTFNLSRYFNEIKVTTEVVKNDDPMLLNMKPETYDFIVFSPGPGRPCDAGLSLKLIDKLLGKCPLLGICLGHQSLAEALGANIVPAKKIIHGKTTQVLHNFDPLFRGIPNRFNVTRYHSLAVDCSSLPSTVKICAWSQEDIMVVKHENTLTYGIQFHPEAFLTDYGHRLLYNFVQLVNQVYKK